MTHNFEWRWQPQKTKRGLVEILGNILLAFLARAPLWILLVLQSSQLTQASNQIFNPFQSTTTWCSPQRAKIRDHGAPQPRREWGLADLQQSAHKGQGHAAYSTKLQRGARTARTACSLIVVQHVGHLGTMELHHAACYHTGSRTTRPNSLSESRLIWNKITDR